MSNKVIFKKEARAKLMDGINLVYEAVSPTLGASGRNTVFNRWSGKPVMTNDGVSIAREIVPEDLGELQGADLAKQVLEEVNDEAGDATTTSCVLHRSMSHFGMELLNNENLKVNPIRLRREIKQATEKVLDEVKNDTITVNSLEDLEKIAITSSESVEIGKTIAKAVHDAGDHGIVYVEESDKVGVSYEHMEGYQFNQGMITPYLINNLEKMETVLEDAAVIITEQQVHLNEDFLSLINTITQKRKNILLICDEIHPEVIQFAVMNTMQRKFTMSIVKKPMQADYLEDLAALVGAFAMTANKGKVKMLPEYVGTAKKITITQKTTTIFDGQGTEKTEYVETMKKQAEESEDEVTKTKLQERIARFEGGVFVLTVGARTPAEQRHLKDKVDDAINAAKKAKEGYVVGGGVALYNIVKRLNGGSMDNHISNSGEYVVFNACMQPIRQIIANAGEDVDAILKEIDAIEGGNPGYDALALEVVPDMIERGITDSVKSIISALSITSDHAGLLLTTETLITPIPEPVNNDRLKN